LYLNGNETNNNIQSSIVRITKNNTSDKYSMFQAIIPSGGIDLETTIQNDVLDTNPHVMMFRATSGTNNMTMQVDGVVQTDTDTGFDRDILFNNPSSLSTTLSGSSFLSIGGNYATGTMETSWQGGIYETIMYDRYITDDELAGLKVYLGNKYGITIS